MRKPCLLFLLHQQSRGVLVISAAFDLELLESLVDTLEVGV